MYCVGRCGPNFLLHVASNVTCVIPRRRQAQPAPLVHLVHYSAPVPLKQSNNESSEIYIDYLNHVSGL